MRKIKNSPSFPSIVRAVLAVLTVIVLLCMWQAQPGRPKQGASRRTTTAVSAKASSATKTTQATQRTTTTTARSKPTTKTTTASRTVATTGRSPYAGLLSRISVKDRDVLARLTYHESRGNGGKAVVEVVLNRVLDACFPNTVQGVVYQAGQFTPASKLYSAAINEPGAFSTCQRIVDEVLSPNYARVLPGHYLYFNAVSPGTGDYRWMGGNVFYG